VKENHEGWPKVVSEDIKGQVLDLKGTVHRVLGQLDGKTLLPLPIDADKIAAAEAVAKSE
jgi:dynein heavy chain